LTAVQDNTYARARRMVARAVAAEHAGHRRRAAWWVAFANAAILTAAVRAVRQDDVPIAARHRKQQTGNPNELT
jgi:hypothetical protein